jgi:hypothetical protein
MAYALIDNGQIESVGALPVAARRQDTGEWVMGLRDAPVDLQQATGWFEVVDTVRPDDTPTTTHDRSVELVAGTPTVVWTERNKTQPELDDQAAAADRLVKQTNYKGAVATLRQWSDQAEGVTVTQGNAVNVLQTLVSNVGFFYDRFADLIEAEYGD